jgi:hypothetical protein
VAVYLTEKERISALDWTRYYCWQIQASKYSSYSDPSDVLWKLRNQSRRSDSDALASKLEAWHPTLDDCVALKLGDE